MILRGSAARLLPVVCLVFLALAAAACGTGEEPEQQPTATAATATPEPTAPSTATADPTTADTSPTPTGRTIRVTVEDGEPRGGVQRVDLSQGEVVTLIVTSDVADTVHVHGYDLTEAVDAGGRARMTFTADIPGVFEVELEDRGVQIAELAVR